MSKEKSGMLHLCIVHKSHKSKVVTWVGLVKKPHALSNKSDVDKYVSLLLRMQSSQWSGCKLGTWTVVLCAA